jgi:hypothetical protein
MNAESILRIAGQVAGIGGLALGLFLIVIRTAFKTLPQPKTVGSSRFFATIDTMIRYTFILSLVGVLAYAFLEVNRRVSTLAAIGEKYTMLEQNYENLKQTNAEMQKQIDKIVEPSLKTIMSPLEVRSSDVTFDLTNWSLVSAAEQQTTKRSYEVTRTKRVVARPSSETRQFAATYATASALEPDFACKTHTMQAIPNKDEEQSGKIKLNRWILQYDISREPLYTPFPIITEITGWNALQNPVQEQEGTLIMFPTKSASLEVLFPPLKRPSSIECFAYPLAQGASPQPVEHPNLEIASDRSRVKWFIDDPRLGYHYEIHWKW